VTDREIEELNIGAETLRADVLRVARVVTERYMSVGAPLTWQVLRDIEEEALCDISLLSRWPLEAVSAFMSPAGIPPNDRTVSPSAQGLAVLPTYICGVFHNGRAAETA